MSAPPDTSQLESLVETLLTIPNELRVFRCGAAEADRTYGVGLPLLTRLSELGLPNRSDGGEALYSSADLQYLGQRLGTAIFHLRTFDAWARQVRRSKESGRSPLRVRYVPHLAEGCEELAGSVLLPDGRLEVTLHSQQPAADIVVAPDWDWPPLDRAIADIVDELAAADHYIFDLDGDALADEYPGCAVTDCRLSARAVFARCRRLGYATRWSYGIIVAPMFSVQHFWVDVMLSDKWVPVDAVTLGLLRRFQKIDRGEWPASASLGGLLVRLSEGWQPIVANQAGELINYSLYTTET